jgi:hypothetical protein
MAVVAFCQINPKPKPRVKVQYPANAARKNFAKAVLQIFMPSDSITFPTP